jgi:hypothetical protein
MYISSNISCLLDLLALLCELPLAPLLSSLWSRLSIHDFIPPSEAACIVANEPLVVNVVMISTGPEGQEVVQAPWELVTAVSIDSLKETEDNPEIHCQDVELTSAQNPNDRDASSAEPEDHDFNGRCVLGGKAERSRVLVVDLVNILVEGTPVHCAM